MFKNSLDNKLYYTYNYFLQKKFGKKVFKVPLDIHLSCPNKINGRSGCIFCKDGSNALLSNDKNLEIQFNNIRDIILKKWNDAYYIGYLQAGTNTYGDLDYLKGIYERIIKFDNVVGLSIATRPDAISDEMMDYLCELNKKTYLTIELGLQSIHDKTLNLINRGHNYECFLDCLHKLQERNINVVVHIINGLPYESKEDMVDTVKALNKENIGGIKIHMLHILKKTPLEELYIKTNFHVLTKEEYVDIVCEQLQYLDENIVIHRITGDPHIEDLIEPKWLIKKFGVLNDIDKRMVELGIHQGCKVK